jgi:hypothetical protein
VVELDIVIIGAVGMHRNLRRKNSDVYITSIYEIDRAIEDKTEQPLDEDLKKSVPEQYHAWLDVFSKKASDKLPPRRPYDQVRIHWDQALFIKCQPRNPLQRRNTFRKTF